MNTRILMLSFIVFFVEGKNIALGTNDVDHDHDHHQHSSENENEKSSQDEEHHEHEEKASNAGPEKGVTSFTEDGLTFSSEAMRTFAIATSNLDGTSPWKIPLSALLLVGEEKSLYRFRDGKFKRITIAIISRTKDYVTIHSDELRIGDSIVTKGVGNIRVAEIDVSSGEVGHHH